MELEMNSLLIIKKKYFMSDGYDLITQPTEKELETEQKLEDTNHLLRVVGFKNEDHSEAICRQVLGMEYLYIRSEQVELVVGATKSSKPKIVQFQVIDGRVWTLNEKGEIKKWRI